jgi:hypothetical protein
MGAIVTHKCVIMCYKYAPPFSFIRSAPTENDLKMLQVSFCLEKTPSHTRHSQKSPGRAMGEPTTPIAPCSCWSDLMRAAKLPWITPHCLRYPAFQFPRQHDDFPGTSPCLTGRRRPRPVRTLGEYSETRIVPPRAATIEFVVRGNLIDFPGGLRE